MALLRALHAAVRELAHLGSSLAPWRGQGLRDAVPLADRVLHWQVWHDGPLNLMKHEGELTPATRRTVLRPGSTPRGKASVHG